MFRHAIAAVVFGLFVVAGTAYAADDASGTWKWKTKFGEKEFEQTLKLEVKDGKVTGTMTAGKGETKIDEGTFKDGELNFTVTRERGDMKFVTKYSGKVRARLKTGLFSDQVLSVSSDHERTEAIP